MHHIVYQSCAIGLPTNAALRFILQQARANNSRLGITGLLLYGNGNFLQVLEGEADVVQTMYARIQADHRHTRVCVLSDGPVQNRIFMDWSMGFQALSGEDFIRLTGYIDPYRSHFLNAHLPSIDEEMMYLLKSFVVTDGARL
ncbi:BLUF domain-containing protein [Hymenobacter elongatus]|uniref:BLUF domain-containing protein n=1 Tax=Hymenobacter elongatus TaxID=877208 RepID=A0A4Z0PQ52_9BACT|nr:BLUF domain-containing protein [Hymenobacter elongatus]TGE18360.1 BLUF domain-containing protein [Hymenobacter elongatus]